jgi:hypothetical protein
MVPPDAGKAKRPLAAKVDRDNVDEVTKPYQTPIHTNHQKGVKGFSFGTVPT